MVLYIQNYNDQGTLLRLRVGLVKVKKRNYNTRMLESVERARLPSLLGLSNVGS